MLLIRLNCHVFGTHRTKHYQIQVVSEGLSLQRQKRFLSTGKTLISYFLKCFLAVQTRATLAYSWTLRNVEAKGAGVWWALWKQRLMVTTDVFFKHIIKTDQRRRDLSELRRYLLLRIYRSRLSILDSSRLASVLSIRIRGSSFIYFKALTSYLFFSYNYVLCLVR